MGAKGRGVEICAAVREFLSARHPGLPQGASWDDVHEMGDPRDAILTGPNAGGEHFCGVYLDGGHRAFVVVSTPDRSHRGILDEADRAWTFSVMVRNAVMPHEEAEWDETVQYDCRTVADALSAVETRYADFRPDSVVFSVSLRGLATDATSLSAEPGAPSGDLLFQCMAETADQALDGFEARGGHSPAMLALVDAARAGDELSRARGMSLARP